MSKKNEHTREMEYWRGDVEALKNDSEHGSVFLADKALSLIEEFVQRQLYKNRTELLQSLSKLNNALVRAKPLMALIHNRSRRVLKFIQNIPREEKNILVIKNATLEEIQQIRAEAEQNLKKIVRMGSRVILDHHVVLTHSASSVVEAILMEAKRLKKRFQLICTESRPLCEGSQLALRMARAGVKTKLIPDADITRALNEAHFVITGTDRFTENSFINKTGTNAIAIVAHELNKPFYVAGESDKILLKRTYPVRYRNINPQEILSQKHELLQIQNIYFEEIPISYLEKVIIEDGIFELKEFIDRYLS